MPKPGVPRYFFFSLNAASISYFDDMLQVCLKNIDLVEDWCCKQAGRRPGQLLNTYSCKPAAFPGEHTPSPIPGCALLPPPCAVVQGPGCYHTSFVAALQPAANRFQPVCLSTGQPCDPWVCPAQAVHGF